MKRTKMVTFFLSLFLILAPGFAGLAADFPTKPIRYIVPFPPGGNTDIMARLIAKPLEKELGTKIFVENIPGGGTKVGTMELMKAKPDGYTIMQATEIAWIGIYYSKSLETKVWEKMTPLANTALEPIGLWEVRTESPFKTFADFIKAAKENPGKLTVALSSRGTFDILISSLAKTAGIEIKHVPFTGGAPGTTALLGGHVDLKFGPPSEGVANLRGGKTRGLALQADKRIPALGNIPTVKECGYDVLLVTATRTIWGPPNMPQSIVDILSKAIERATKDPEFVKMVEENFVSKVEFRPGPKVMEAAKNMDKQLGPLLAEFYKDN